MGGVYDESKRFAESLTLAYHRMHELDTKIVRIFNSYGPNIRKNDRRAIPNFISQALHNKPVTVYGDGSQTRSFCYIYDLVDGILRLMKSKINVPVDIGNPKEMLVLDLAKEIIAICSSWSKIVLKGLPVNDPRKRQPDIRFAMKHLRWKPKTRLKTGLRKLLDGLNKSFPL